MVRPLSTKKDWQAVEKKVFMQVFNRIPVTLVRGKGTRVWDDEGREYLDFVGGLAVVSLGHCHPVMVKALSKQAKTLTQTSNIYYTIPQLQLCELLVKTSCLDRAFIANSGTEAVEGAIKLARRYGKLKLDGAYEIITVANSFHGRTLAATAATAQPSFQEPFTPLPAGFVNAAFNDVEAIKKATTKLTCAVMLEPIQGEGGVNVPDDDYLKKVRAWCDEKGLLLILDEIQTGIGRTGSHVRLRAVRRRAGYHDPGQGHGQRNSHRGVPRQRERLRFQAGRAWLDLRRQPAGVRRSFRRNGLYS